MDKRDFYFELPKELIAQTPLKNRAASRLLVLDKNTGALAHKEFTDIINILEPNDCIVINNTKVIPARLIGQKDGGAGEVELLLLNNKADDIWEALVKPGKRAQIGHKIIFGNGLLLADVVGITQDGNRLIKFYYNGIFEEVLDKLGEMPLPPYITEKLQDKTRYQTVYAKESGSAAAPTAGLHFTQELMSNISQKGVQIAYVTLHVGLGTFRPVKSEKIEDHKIHTEFYILEQTQAKIINDCKQNGGRIIAVGTTSVRTLETCASEYGLVSPNSGYTGIFIYPGYDFKVTDGIITNFHLPESTLIMLVSAFSSRERVLSAYEEAIRQKYRFFSFGDAMLLI